MTTEREDPMTHLAKAQTDLHDARVAFGVMVGLFPAELLEEYRERLQAIREDTGPEWICPACGSRYVADVGRCGQLQPFECREVVVPLPARGQSG